MRLAALLVLAVPACALAQPAPAPPAKPAARPPAADHRPHPAAPQPNAKPHAKSATPDKKPAPPKPQPRKPPAPHPAVPVPAPAPAEPPPTEPGKGSSTGLPLPRFAALRSDDVNFRSGPGTRYPIDWVYKRRDLPVEIEREYDLWRLVRDPAGNKGWVHQATLTGRRTAVVTGAEHELRQSASDAAAAVAALQPGVIVRLRACEAGSEWCQAQIGDYRGFIRRSEVWGVSSSEVIQ